MIKNLENDISYNSPQKDEQKCNQLEKYMEFLQLLFKSKFRTKYYIDNVEKICVKSKRNIALIALKP
jgi:hypothetical protein